MGHGPLRLRPSRDHGVELRLDKDGTIKVQTVSRKKLNIIASRPYSGGREELNGADRRNPAGSFFICKVR